jgi:hypothetical protein
MELGVSVPVETPFREYAALLDNIGDVTLPETTTDQDLLQVLDLHRWLGSGEYEDCPYTDGEIPSVYNLLDTILEGEEEIIVPEVTVYGVKLISVGKTNYFVGETFDSTHYVVKIVYSDGSAVDVTDDCVFTVDDPLTEASTEVTITYNLDGIDYVFVQPIKVKVFVPELIVTRDILDQGTFKNVTPTYLTNQIDGSDGFTIVGRNSSSSGSAKHSGNLRWTISLDLSGWDTLTFYAKKNANHGMIRVGIENNNEIVETLLSVLYNDGPTTWTKYNLDISKYDGVTTVFFVGGYTDSTGNTSSSTSYCGIKFK